jgi:predicted Zn finger-like uncharacterized protein
MLIVCPTCAMTYQVKLAALGEAGRTVRCANCKNTWFATPDSALTEEVAFAQAEVSGSRSAAKSALDDWDVPADEANVDPFEAAPAGEPDAAKALAVMEAPPLVPSDAAVEGASAAAKFDPGEPDNIETIAARRARHAYTERKQKRSVLQQVFSIPMLIVVLTAILLSALTWRVALVRQFPQTASLFSMLGMPVNLRGLSFMDVKSRGEFVDGTMVLVIEGTIVNLTPRALEVPRLRFGLRNGAGHEVYAWTSLPSKTTLGSGDGLAFRTRLASPPGDGRDVIVRFFNRRDAGLGSGS